ncbi:hypothetical protein VPH35_001718 [Triticum aestivum]
MSGLTFLDVYFIQRATTLRRLPATNNPMTLHQVKKIFNNYFLCRVIELLASDMLYCWASSVLRTNLILGRQRSDKDENGIPDYTDGGSDMDLLLLLAGILDVLEALPYTRATFGTCVGSCLCQCNLHLSADYGDLGYWPTGCSTDGENTSQDDVGYYSTNFGPTGG